MNKKGTTLVEIIISAAIIAVVFMSVISFFVVMVDASKRIDGVYTSANLAKNRIERARRLVGVRGFDFLIDLEEVDTVIDETGTANPEGVFTRTTDVTTSYSGNERLARIDVSVYYKMRGKKCTTPMIMTTVFGNID